MSYLQKSVFCLCIATILSTTPVHSAEPDLLEPISESRIQKRTNLNPDLVVQYRYVKLNPDMAPWLDDERLDLNFFPDTTLPVILTAPIHLANGSRVRTGKIANEDVSLATVAVNNGIVSLTVFRGEYAYKLRHLDHGIYMIREVLVPEEDPPGTVRASQHRSDRAVSISAETQVLEIVNQERAENNLGALAWNDLLFESARGHSVDMADQDYFSHESLDGRTPAQRVAAAGYDYNSMAENIAAGHGTPQAVMEGWMASDGHRANILSEDVCDLGVGYAYDAQSTYGHYWTQNFGRQAGVADCPIIPDTGSNSPPDTTGSDESGGGGSGGCFIESIQHTIP